MGFKSRHVGFQDLGHNHYARKKGKNKTFNDPPICLCIHIKEMK
jgi:hypothetical protein